MPLITLEAALRRYGASDKVLNDPRYALALRVPTIPACGHSSHVGHRLDCVLAHFEDVHEWTHAELARWITGGRPR